MKYCSVCDREIRGSWCKHCHRFVKSYESGASLYGSDESRSMEDGERSFRPMGTKENTTKKRKKSAVFGISLSALLACTVPYLTDISDGVMIVFDKLKAEEEANRRYFEDEILISEEEREFYGNRMKRNTEILKLTPAESVIERENRVFYFKPEDIKRMGYACDGLHFELKFAEFEQWLDLNWTEDYEVEEDSSVYSNLRSIEGETERYRFATYRNYRSTGEFSVRIEYDTATEQLHEVYFKTKEAPMDTLLCHELIKKFDSLTRLKEETFAESLKDALDGGEEYASLYVSERVSVSFVKSDVGYCVVFCPVEREW